MRLIEYLTKNKLRPANFAARINVPTSTISRILSGKRSPGLELLQKIMDGTHGAVTPNDFLQDLTHQREGALMSKTAELETAEENLAERMSRVLCDLPGLDIERAGQRWVLYRQAGIIRDDFAEDEWINADHQALSGELMRRMP